MAPQKLSVLLANRTKQKAITATVISVLGNRCTVALSGRGSRLNGIGYVGAQPKVGSTVIVDYQSGSPKVYSIASGMNDSEPDATTAIPTSQISTPTSNPPENPNQTSDHNSLPGLQGGKPPIGGSAAEYFHFNQDDYNALMDFIDAGLTEAGGEENDVQYKNVDGGMSGDHNLKWRSSSQSLQIGNPDNTGLKDVFPQATFYALRSDGQGTVLFLANFDDNVTGVRGNQIRGFRAGGEVGPVDISGEHTPWGAVLEGMALVTMVCDGWDGVSGVRTGGRMTFVADSNWTPTSTPTRMSLFIIRDGEVASSSSDPGYEALRIDGYSSKFNVPIDFPSLVVPPDTPGLGYGRVWVDELTGHLYFKNSDGDGFDLTIGTEALIHVTHDYSLTGDGTVGSPLGINRFVHTQGVPAADWDITHNLNAYPNVVIVDSGGAMVFGEVDYTTLNTLSLHFSAAFAGKAYIT